MPSAAYSAATVRVSMLSPALAMFVCGCLAVLRVRLKLPSIAETCTTYRSGKGDAASSGAQLAGEQERHEGVDDVGLQPLPRRHVAEPQRPAVRRAQVQRLAGLVALARRGKQLHKGLSTRRLARRWEPPVIAIPARPRQAFGRRRTSRW